jgi:HindVP restriction endonuclease
MENQKAGLYGINNSNRDFELRETWGKNQFNSSFPAALSAFLSSQNLDNIYIKLDKNFKTFHTKISTTDLIGISPNSNNLFYAFENAYTPYQQLVIGSLPRVDLVTQDKNTGNCLKGLEIKLTALPDNTTCHLSDDLFGTELVIRPDTIVYLACSIAYNFKDNLVELRNVIGNNFENISDWGDAEEILPIIPKMIEVIDTVALQILEKQQPLIMQPIWKTEGKSSKLSENCLDIFIWSNLAFTQLFLDVAREEVKSNKITRQVRTIIWLFKMLFDFSLNCKINYAKIIDELSFNTKNDKAFAVSGRITQPYMRCEELKKPRILKTQIKDIILGGGQNLLSPERRFDAIISNSPEIFD